MLKQYLKRCKPELLALIKHVDQPSWEKIVDLEGDEQLDALFAHPEVCSGIAYHLISQAGFGTDAMVQHRITRKIFCVAHSMITLNLDHLPVQVMLYGYEEGLPVGQAPIYLGRLEDFVSMQTGLNILPGDLFELVPELG